MALFFVFEAKVQSVLGTAIPAGGTRFKPASPAGLRAQAIPPSGLFEKVFAFLLSFE